MKWMDFSLKECGVQGLSFLHASLVFSSRSAWYHARYISGGTIRACSKAHYRSESVTFHWLYGLSSLRIVLGDLLEESSSATELLRFLGYMVHCFRGTRCISGSSSFWCQSESEIELDAFIGEGRLIDPSCFTSSLEVEFVYFLF